MNRVETVTRLQVGFFDPTDLSAALSESRWYHSDSDNMNAPFRLSDESERLVGKLMPDLTSEQCSAAVEVARRALETAAKVARATGVREIEDFFATGALKFLRERERETLLKLVSDYARSILGGER